MGSTSISSVPVPTTSANQVSSKTQRYFRELAKARSIKDPQERILALRNLAGEMSKAGMDKNKIMAVFKEAIETARTITCVDYTYILDNIASDMAKAGMDKSKVREVFNKAIKSAHFFRKDIDIWIRLFSDISSKMAEARLFKEAIETSRTISYPIPRINVLINIASGMVGAGINKNEVRRVFKEAADMACAIDNYDKMRMYFDDISSAMASNGFSKEEINNLIKETGNIPPNITE